MQDRCPKLRPACPPRMALKQTPSSQFAPKLDVQLFKDQTLGIGSYGKVCKARYGSLPCAAKLIHETLFDPEASKQIVQEKKHRLPFKRFEQECEVLHNLRHPNVIQYLGVYQDPDTKLPVLLMELMDGSLTHYLEDPSLQQIPFHIQVNFCHDIALALSFLHANKVVHRDLSSNNVLLISNIRAKVTDFGMATLRVNEQVTQFSHTMCPGTDAYMPPEAVQDKPVYTEKIDCFSFGVLVIQILTQLFPAPGNRHEEMKNHPGLRKGRKVMVTVPEVERRDNHIVLIDPSHPLLVIALDCLKDLESDRPSALQICERVAALKESAEYTKSNKEADKAVKLESLRNEKQRVDGSFSNNLKEKELHKALAAKEKEIAELKKQLAFISAAKDQGIAQQQKEQPPLDEKVNQQSLQLDNVSKESGLTARDSAPRTLLERPTGMRQAPASKKDSVQLGLDNSPKPRSKSMNEPKQPTSPESTEANTVAEMTSPTRQPGAAKGRIPPPVLPKLAKPVDRLKFEKFAAVSAELQYSIPPAAKEGSMEHDLSEDTAPRRTSSPQTSPSDVPEGKANDPASGEESSTLPPLITSAPPPSAPLPAGWTERKTPSGHTYYYNSTTRESLWTRPQPASDSSSEGQTNLLDRVAPCGWTREINPITSTPIYTNSRTGERWALAKDGVGNYFYYNMSNPTLTVEELPEDTATPHDDLTESTENLCDSIDPPEVSKSVEASPSHTQTPSHVDLVASSYSGVQKDGYMQRKRLFDSQGKKIKSGWQKVYVVLENHELRFYTDHKVRDNPSAKPLSIYCVLQSTISPYTKDKKKSVFQVSSPFGEQFLLQAETSRLMNDWYSTIQTAINGVNQEFKDHPENFKSIGDFTLDGEAVSK